ncbi:hypothetical protein NM208_g10054 [Fusarium decemcellulare]|uniref:Uncharacterized protein n=1 Tax=Fusarium decemcellulare TaxID=57161 RepID=A0ACC1RZ99_9HYPO|nr:hypothetical protein NM208_g10054 [Fusarium decemcellulare]
MRWSLDQTDMRRELRSTELVEPTIASDVFHVTTHRTRHCAQRNKTAASASPVSIIRGVAFLLSDAVDVCEKRLAPATQGQGHSGFPAKVAVASWAGQGPSLAPVEREPKKEQKKKGKDEHTCIRAEDRRMLESRGGRIYGRDPAAAESCEWSRKRSRCVGRG